MRGWVSPILTNAFLEQIKNNLKDISDIKVSHVTKGCLKNLARAKNAMHVQKRKKSIFEAINFTHPPFQFLKSVFQHHTTHAEEPKIV